VPAPPVTKNGGGAATAVTTVPVPEGSVSTTAYPSQSVVPASGAGRMAGCGAAGVLVLAFGFVMMV